MTKRARLSFAGITLAIAAVASLIYVQDMDTANADSGIHNGHPVVVELFTSQGCYSCPPADKYVGVLKQRENVIALAYHVDYWDYIGWKDPFASPVNTQRQRGYSKAMGLWSIYTPQMVIDGRLEGVGSRTREISSKISRVSGMNLADRVSIPINLDTSANGLSVRVEGGAAPEDGDVWLIAYDEEKTTSIPRGENAGKTLTEYNIVRGVWRLGDWKGQPFSTTVRVKDLEVEADKAVVLLQERGQGPIYGAALASLR
ncbi:MAG: DUF1223 domain-containing protein [Alphaproteobacteria bacterium]|jgi:hypothetical protein|nr:DUF1223 domain-containing protein [Alphaproteobacteria bacterium]